MTYIDLGKFNFTTGLDYTGLNTGNLTSVLDLNSIRVPYFELYRLLIDTSKLPPITAISQVVQVTPVVSTSSTTTVTLAFPANVTKGNNVIVAWGAFSTSTANGDVTGVTLGGSADNWGTINFFDGTPASGGTSTGLFMDTNAQVASTAVVITTSGGAAPLLQQAMALEVSGLTTDDSANIDQASFFANQAAGQSAWTCSNGITTVANDFQIGTALFQAGQVLNVTDNTGYTDYFQGFDNLPAAGKHGVFTTSWFNPGPAGSGSAYQLTSTPAARGSMLTASLIPATINPAAVAYPFTINTGQTQWDMQTTTPGVGYTYSIGQSPLALISGQNLYILWTTLPYAQYSGYIPGMNITAWFRYDPATAPATAAGTGT